MTSPITPDEAAWLFRPFDDNAPLILAVSGGPDSTALMGLFADYRSANPGVAPVVVAIDHGLRDASRAEAEATLALAARLGMAAECLSWTEEKPATGIQEAARAARYRLLAGAALRHGADGVMLAHTLDDQAETVLMRLARGSGLRGLGGMRPMTEAWGCRLLRPFLAVPKARLIETCKHRGWPFVSDPSNSNARFLRPRLRALMPTLATEGLSSERLSVLARRAQRADAVLAERTVEVLAAAAVPDAAARRVRFDMLSHAGAEIVVRALDRLVVETGGTQVRLERVEALAERLLLAGASGLPFTATLGGARIVLCEGILEVRPAPPRRTRR